MHLSSLRTIVKQSNSKFVNISNNNVALAHCVNGSEVSAQGVANGIQRENPLFSIWITRQSQRDAKRGGQWSRLKPRNDNAFTVIAKTLKV